MPSPTDTTSVRTISSQQARALLHSERKLQIVDIRTPELYQASHITNAQLLNEQNLADFLRAADPDTPTLVYCYHGIASVQAAQILANHDFSEVYSLDGGFEQWQRDYPQLTSAAL